MHTCASYMDAYIYIHQNLQNGKLDSEHTHACTHTHSNLLVSLTANPYIIFLYVSSAVFFMKVKLKFKTVSK